MKKTIMAAILAVVMLLTCTTALAATKEDEGLIQPQTTAAVGSSLSMYNGTQMQIYVTCNLNVKESVVITTSLEQWTGSTWKTYKSFVKTGYGTNVALSAKVSAPLGYKYRTKSNITTTSLSGIVSYSKELYWY